MMKYELHYIRTLGLIPSVDTVLCQSIVGQCVLVYNILGKGDPKLGTEEEECQDWGQREARSLQAPESLPLKGLKSD